MSKVGCSRPGPEFTLRAGVNAAEAVDICAHVCDMLDDAFNAVGLDFRKTSPSSEATASTSLACIPKQLPEPLNPKPYNPINPINPINRINPKP